ncbi:hypothetical protein [Pseudomonas sp. S1_E04]
MNVTKPGFSRDAHLARAKGKRGNATLTYNYEGEGDKYSFSTTSVTMWPSQALISYDDGWVGTSWTYPSRLVPGEHTFELMKFDSISFHIGLSEYSNPMSGEMKVRVEVGEGGAVLIFTGTIMAAKIRNEAGEGIEFESTFSGTFP